MKLRRTRARWMASLCHFYGGLTPDDVRGMSMVEVEEFQRYMHEAVNNGDS